MIASSPKTTARPAAKPHPADGPVAAVDLGSNSFHMIVGRLEKGRLHIVDKVRESVRLGAGLDDDRHLRSDARERALACLARFGERLRPIGRGNVRIVGTNTLRQARDADAFLREAERAVGHPIEVISGHEEARLIYLGVLQTMPRREAPRLVLDIGGGSTELILGKGPEVVRADSFFMGCVNFSTRFFPGGKLNASRFERAELAAGVELESSIQRYRALGWDEVVGCSGTIHAIREIGEANGWCGEGITLEALEKIEKRLVDAGRLEDVRIEGLAEDRRPVIAGGVAILRSCFERLAIEQMRPAPGALREGVLYDLVSRAQNVDVRDRTLQWFCQHYAVDREQASRVERTALELLEQAAAGWELDVERDRQILSWAAVLHEIGLAIAHTGYQKHSAYLVENSDMAGFSRNDQREIAAILRAMRRKMKRSYFEPVPEERRNEIVRLAVLFRVARTLHRSRSEAPLPELHVSVETDESGEEQVQLAFPAGWLAGHDLTREDLHDLVEVLEHADIELTTREA